MAKKKLIIILAIFIGLALIILLSSDVFKLTHVELSFTDEYRENVDPSDEEIIKDGYFDYGSSMFMLNKDLYIKNLESANPYLKVINIESKFPNKIVINCYERIEVYNVAFDGGYAITDNELFVLDKTTGINPPNDRTTIDMSSISLSKVKTGDYLPDIQSYNMYARVAICLEEYALSTSDNLLPNMVEESIGKIFESVKISEGKANIKLEDGLTLIIDEADEYLLDKFRLGMSTFDKIKSEGKDVSKGYIDVRKVGEGKIQAFTDVV